MSKHEVYTCIELHVAPRANSRGSSLLASAVDRLKGDDRQAPAQGTCRWRKGSSSMTVHSVRQFFQGIKKCRSLFLSWRMRGGCAEDATGTMIIGGRHSFQDPAKWYVGKALLRKRYEAGQSRTLLLDIVVCYGIGKVHQHALPLR